MHNAAVMVPYAMIATIVINGIMGFGFLLALLFCIGDVDSVLNTATGYPVIQIFYNTTGSTAAASAMTCSIIVMAVFATAGLLASASRTTWSFARDNGLPFSAYLSEVRVKTHTT
jgi:choline transport protein